LIFNGPLSDGQV
jgi:hypothetical protein